MEISVLYDEEIAAVVAKDEGCRTPKHGIPARSAPPPPPRKKLLRVSSGKKEPPKNGYFQSPDLEQLFVVRPRPEACA